VVLVVGQIRRQPPVTVVTVVMVPLVVVVEEVVPQITFKLLMVLVVMGEMDWL
jgi:hypothetical protein